MPRTALATESTDKPKRPYTRRATGPTIVPPAKHETHSEDFPLGHPSTITDDTPRNDVSREKSSGERLFGRRLKQTGDLMMLDGIEVDQAYLDELAFNEEWLEIIINPSTHKNAADIFENWCNGVGAEMLINGKTVVVRDLPVDVPITVKRKIVEHIIRARVTDVRTIYESTNVENPRNAIGRTDSRVHSFTILHDPSGAKGLEWQRMVHARKI